MDVLNKIANLILEDPFLTAGQLAKRLGYAEEKTIYYWIDKAHYSGLTAFKRAVLQGRYRFQSSEPNQAQERIPRYGSIPIVTEFTADGTPILSGDYVSTIYLLQPILFAWRYSGVRIANILPGDLLMATADEAHSPHRWTIAFNARRQAVLRLSLFLANDRILFNPATQSVDLEATPRYTLCHLYRAL